MSELLPNAWTGDLPIYWKDVSGLQLNVPIDQTFYGKTNFYFNSQSYENFKLLSDYAWNLGDPCGEGTLGEISTHLNNFFNFLKGVQQFNNTYIIGSINTIQNLSGQIRNVSEAIAGVLRSLIQRVRNWVMNQIRSLVDSALEALLTPLTKQIKEGILQGVIDQLVCAFDQIIDGLVDFVGDFLYSLVGQIINTPLCAIESYLNAMMNRLSSDIEASIGPALNSINDILGGALNVAGQVSSVIGQILGYESFFCSRPECPEVKEFKASIWGGPTPSAIANFQSFTAASTGLVNSAQATADQWLADFFGPTSNSSQSPGSCYTGIFQCGLPQVVIFGGGGSGAVGNAVVNAIGEVIGVNLLNGGSGYSSPPFVSIVDPAGCGVNASASAVLCPPTSNSTSSANQIPGYTTPGIYLNLYNAPSGPAPIGFNSPGIYLDLTSATSTSNAGTITVTITTVKNASSAYTVTIPGQTSSGNPLPVLPVPQQNIIPVQISFDLTVGRIYGPITKTGPGTLYIGNQSVPGVSGSGSLTNQSIVIEEGGDDWDDYVLTTSEGFFTVHNTPPQASSSSTVNSGNVPVLFTRQATTGGYSINLPTPTGSQALFGPSVSGGPAEISTVTLSAGSLYGPLTIGTGAGTLYVGDEVVSGISSSGSLPNTSVVIEEGGDDWDDMILSTSHGFFANYTSAPTTSSTTSSNSSTATSSVCAINMNNSGSGYASTANNGVPVINSFTGTPNPITTNNTITLSWSVTNATNVSLNVPGYNNVPLNGNASFVVNPNFTAPQTTVTYTLTATNTQQNSAAQITTQNFIVTVNQSTSANASNNQQNLNTNTPTINSFTASPTTVGVGSIVTLSWDTTDALYTSLDVPGYSSLPDDGSVSLIIPPVQFPANGNAVVSYALTATNPNAAAGNQTATSSVSVNVTPPVAPVVAAAATPAVVAAPVASAVGIFTCTPSVVTLDEGDTVDFNIVSTGATNNGTYYYDIVQIFGAVTASDFTDNALSGSFTIANNVGTFSKTIANDSTLENLEQFNVLIKASQNATTFLASSGTISINAGVGTTSQGTPAIAQLNNIQVQNTGYGYTVGSGVTILGGNNGSQLQLQVTPSGQVTGVQILNPGYGFTRIPEIQINSNEGLGVKLRANLKFTPLDQFLREQNLKSVDPTKLVRIIDCVSR